MFFTAAWGLYLASDEARPTGRGPVISPSPSRRCNSTSAAKPHQLNSVAPLAKILNDVIRVWRASLNLHWLFAHEAAQEINQWAFIVVQIKSFSPRSTRRPRSRQSGRDIQRASSNEATACSS
jgi:hypothetical protein